MTLPRLLRIQEEKTGKKVSLYLSHRYSGMKLKGSREYFGISDSGVTQVSRRLGKKNRGRQKAQEEGNVNEKQAEAVILSNVWT